MRFSSNLSLWQLLALTAVCGAVDNLADISSAVQNATFNDATSSTASSTAVSTASGNNSTHHKIHDKNIHHAVKEWMQDKHSAKLKYGHISHWDTQHVTDMSFLFSYERLHEFGHFKEDVTKWNTHKVRNMTHMFYGNAELDMDFSHWNTTHVADFSGFLSNTKVMTGKGMQHFVTSNAHNMTAMFNMALAFNNSHIAKWDTSSVKDMHKMFHAAKSFHGNQHFKWRTSKVHDMSLMFAHANLFTGDVSDFDVSSVTNMNSMFVNAAAFNGGLSKWDTQKVHDFSHMFAYANKFAGSGLETWNVHQAHTMEDMFKRAEAVDFDVSKWNVTKADTLANMFRYATAFSQEVCWNLSAHTNVTGIFFNSKGHFSHKCVPKQAILASCCDTSVDKTCGCDSTGVSKDHKVVPVDTPAGVEANPSNGMGEGKTTTSNSHQTRDHASTGKDIFLAFFLAVVSVVGVAACYIVRKRKMTGKEIGNLEIYDNENMMVSKDSSEFDTTVLSTSTSMDLSSRSARNNMIPDDDNSVADDLVDVEDLGPTPYPAQIV